MSTLCKKKFYWDECIYPNKFLLNMLLKCEMSKISAIILNSLSLKCNLLRFFVIVYKRL